MSDKTNHLLPVIDLKGGVVVHGVAGKREHYQPISSKLVDSARPGEVAKALIEKVAGQKALYVADLDAIEGREPDRTGCAAIRDVGAVIWLDPGVADLDAVRRCYNEIEFDRLIVALETLQSLRTLESILNEFSHDQIVFSVDLADGLPRARDAAAGRLSAETVASYAIDAGVRSLIVLDVTSVGSQQGGTTLDLCRKIRARYPDIELVSGGGVRDWNDVDRFVEAGCDRVLVASAIHTGVLLP